MKILRAEETAMQAIYLVRHGHPELPDDAPRFLGRTDLPLSERGRGEARRLKAALESIPFDLVVHSGLRRAEETAAIVTEGRTAPLRVERAFQEIRCGDWEMRTLADIAASDPEAFEARAKDFAGYRPPGGESFTDVRDRAWPAFQSLLKRERGDLLVVAHAGVLRALIVAVLGLSWEKLFSVTQDYCGVHVLERHDDHLMVRRLNWLPDLRPK